jgi:hypothetical protein
VGVYKYAIEKSRTVDNAIPATHGMRVIVAFYFSKFLGQQRYDVCSFLL